MELKPETVRTREDFARYVEQLEADYASNPGKWENTDLGSFLAAVAGYARDVDGYYSNADIPVDADKPDWRVFGDILTGACVYE